MNKRILGGFFIFLLIVAGLLYLSARLNTQINNLSHTTPSVPAAVHKPDITAETKPRYDARDVTIRTQLDPSRQFILKRFYYKDQEIASVQLVNDQVVKKEGIIPDGRMSFVDLTEKTDGYEEYLNGERYGEAVENYDNGRKKREAVYAHNKLVNEKVYYYDGILRMEKNLEDAMWITNNSEVGEGKVYYRDGKLMYEWKLTNRDQGGYNKSYNKEGKLVNVRYLDETGEIIKEENYR